MVQPAHQARTDLVHDATGEALRAQAAGLMRDGRMEDAAALLAQGRRLFPDDAHLLLDQATLAEAMDDLDGAVELLEAAIDQHPGMEAAYLRAGALCRRLGRPHQAETILLEGMCRLPSGIELFAAHAAIAAERQDWRQAARRYRLICERFPSHAWAHAHLATALRSAKRLPEAERALLQGALHVPHDGYFPVEYAEVAAERGDWAEAARRFKAAGERFPASWWAYKRHAEVLKRAGDAAQAEAILLEAQERHPQEHDLFLDHAELAFERRDWDEGLRRFGIVRDRFPHLWWPCKRIADTLRAAGRLAEAEAALLDGQLRAPDEPALFGDHADLAFERGDWSESLRRFGIVRDRFPHLWWSYKRIADTLRATGRPDEAEAVLLDGQLRAPDEPALFGDHADLAFNRRDWDESLRRFGIVRDRFPHLWWPYRRIADTLRAAGRPDQAEAVLLEGQGRHPRESDLFLDHAELAGARRDWPEALLRFEDARARFPGLWAPLRGIVQTYVGMDRFDEAERVIQQGIELFPDDPEPLFEHAGLAQWTNRPEEAIERYRLIQRRHPDNYGGHFRVACAVAAAGRLEEAEAMLIRVMEAFPEERGTLTEIVKLTIQIPAENRRIPVATLEEMVDRWIERCGDAEDLLLARAQLAQIKGDYQGYLQRLLHVARVNPNARSIDERIAAARELLLGRGELAPEELGRVAAPPSGADRASLTRQELLGLFESLGGGGPGGSPFYGCEFGFVQREVTLEPLSLLRWTGVGLEDATRLLANDFRGIGEADNCALNGIENHYDWQFVDNAYGLHCSHTHLDRLTVARDAAVQMMCQRTRFLARKLREDLEDGEKIFVYRYLGPIEDDAAGALALARAVNAHGSNMLLFVCRPDAQHAPLTVRLVHPGLMIGHIDWFASDRHNLPANVDGWTRVCEDAYRIWQDQRAGGTRALPEGSPG